jgi:hypothetical protein
MATEQVNAASCRAAVWAIEAATPPYLDRRSPAPPPAVRIPEFAKKRIGDSCSVGAARAYAEGERRNQGGKNRHHAHDGTAVA